MFIPLITPEVQRPVRSQPSSSFACFPVRSVCNNGESINTTSLKNCGGRRGFLGCVGGGAAGGLIGGSVGHCASVGACTLSGVIADAGVGVIVGSLVGKAVGISAGCLLASAANRRAAMRADREERIGLLPSASRDVDGLDPREYLDHVYWPVTQAESEF